MPSACVPSTNMPTALLSNATMLSVMNIRLRSADCSGGTEEIVAVVGNEQCVPLDNTSAKKIWAIADCDPPPPTSSTAAFEVALTMNLIIAAILFVFFALLFPRSPRVYQPRLLLAAKPPKPLPKVGTALSLPLPSARTCCLCSCWHCRSSFATLCPPW